MRAFGVQPHVLKGKADLTAHILAPVNGGHIKVAAVIKGYGSCIAVFVGFKEIEFAFGADLAFIARRAAALNGLAQKLAGVALKGAPVRMQDRAVKARNASLLRSPGQKRKCGRLRL